MPPPSTPTPHCLSLARSTVDRSTVRRTDERWISEAWQDPATRVLTVGDGQVLMSGPSTDAGEAQRPSFVSPDEAPEGERYLLGVEDGIAYFAVAAAPDTTPSGTPAAGLREIGALLGDRDAGLVVHAIALQRWHATHTHCARCGASTEVAAAGHVRRCPRDGSEHFPRVDPAVIMLVRDDDDRCVLGRQPSWPERRFSVLAGFVEPGESLEHAVAREVSEEVGVEITDIRYFASQPWPFPSSLMLGFTARALKPELHVDNDEIAEAYWFRREELRAAVDEGSILLPGRVSIARRLIEDWYGGELPGSW